MVRKLVIPTLMRKDRMMVKLVQDIQASLCDLEEQMSDQKPSTGEDLSAWGEPVDDVLSYLPIN